MELLDLIGNKEVWVTGKGGIGKTTTSAALALHYAKNREWVLAFDIDGYRSMPDALCAEQIDDNRFRVPENEVHSLFEDKIYRALRADLDLCLVSPRKVLERVQANRKENPSKRTTGLPSYFGILHMYDVLDQLGVLTASSDLAALCLITAERQIRLNSSEIKNGAINARFIYDNQSSNATIELLAKATGAVERMKNMKKHNLEWRAKAAVAGWKDLGAFVKDDYIKNIEHYITSFSNLTNTVRDPKKSFYLVVSGAGRTTETRETERLVQELKETGFPVGFNSFNKVNPVTQKNINQYRSGMFGAPVYTVSQLGVFESENDVVARLGEFVSSIKPFSS